VVSVTTRAPTLVERFIRAVPNQLAKFGTGLEDTSALAAFQSHGRPAEETEIRRALALVDRAARVWSAAVIKPTGQTTIAEWVAQLPAADSPGAAGHLGGLLSTAKSAASGYGRHTVLAASLAAAAANEIVDDIPGADNGEALAKVAEEGASSLAAWAIETTQADHGVGEAVATAEMLAGIE
jgi:hypothetical protein